MTDREIISEGITILECVYREFEDFTLRGGKRDYLVNVWQDIISQNLKLDTYIPAIKELCATHKNYPSLSEIIEKMKNRKKCPFDYVEEENE